MIRSSYLDGNDHTNMTAPLPVRSAKLSMFGPGQYYGGGPRWNPRCCSLFVYLTNTVEKACSSNYRQFARFASTIGRRGCR
eukprot:scaffold1223_cov119-Cylindrotheca_fusiformis.AAC.10